MGLNKKSNRPRHVAQCKTPVSAQSSKRPVAPPVYRPQPVPKVLQRKSSTAPPVYRPNQLQASPPRPLLSRSQTVQRSLEKLPYEMTQTIASFLDQRSLLALRQTNKNLSKQLQEQTEELKEQRLTELLVPGILEKKYLVNENNYESICAYMEKKLGRNTSGICANLKFHLKRVDNDLSEPFWNNVRIFISREQLRELLSDPKFTSQFGHYSYWEWLTRGFGEELYDFFK